MTVYLVGAGPGDPDLITRRGARLLEGAEAVVFDRLTASDLLELVPGAAERHFVGKGPGRPSVPQDDINRLLVDLGRRYDTVVRLKGGDPFLFARGSEEAEALASAGVSYQVVPGVSSSLAVPATAGIPVTRRFDSTSVTIVTGHEASVRPAGGESVDWDAVAKVGGTIVVLMGVARIDEICSSLIGGGRSPDTPAAAIRWGTTTDQEVVVSTLAGLPGHDLRAPSVIVVGEVVAWRRDWWSAARPLSGAHIAVTRPVGQNAELAGRLRELGARVTVAPALRVVPPTAGTDQLLDRMRRLEPDDWLVVTSANGANAALDAVTDARSLGGVNVAAVGPATERALRGRGIVADLVPPVAVAESLLEAFPAAGHPGRSVVLARAETGRAVLVDGLAAKGWTVFDVAAYRTEGAPIDAAVRTDVADADMVVVTSPAGFQRVLSWLEREERSPTRPLVVTIGPVTSAAVEASGWSVAAEASPHTDDGVVAAVVQRWVSN